MQILFSRGSASLLFLIVLFLSNPICAAIKIDGDLSEPEWQQAQHFTDFRELTPLSEATTPTQFKTEAWLLSTPEGIAVALRALQPIDVARNGARVQRDFGDQVDRANFMIDFDADGRAAYDFTISAGNDISDEVISQENQFNKDWDADWQHAVKTDDSGYQYEWLIPWSSASMKDAVDGKRKIGVYFDRVIAATGQRFGTPIASFTKPRFVSDFTTVEVNSYQSSLLAITPYVVAAADFKNDSQDFKAGADLFWKPNANHQYAATLYPDFGQVESDQLVVNFDAIETFFTDKRPFFTDNQTAYLGAYPGGNLFYTRRVGGTADDGSGAGEIKAAVKGNGSFGEFGYAFFAADESDDAGRSFYLARANHQVDQHELVLTQTYVDRPFLDRTASVSAMNSVWKPNDEWSINSAIHTSNIHVGDQSVSGTGGGIIADWDMPGPWRQQYFFIQVGKNENLNDLGFQDRNNFRNFEWESGYRQDQLAEDSIFASHAWEFELASIRNLDNLPIRESATVQRFSELRNGGNTYGFIRLRRDAYDDLISRGNGPIRIKGGGGFFVESFFPRKEKGLVDWYGNLEVNSVRLGNGFLVRTGVQPKFHPTEQLDFDLGVFVTLSPDWLLWQGGTEFGSFKQKQIEFESNWNWFIDSKQELRVKLQSIAIDATAKQARRIGADSNLVDSVAPLNDFNIQNLGFQIRYRYKLGPLSDIFAVYSRGGFADDETQRDAFDSLRDSFELRDDDQFLVKLAYRFEP